MSRELLRRAFLVIPLGLATLAGCTDTDTTAPMLGSNPLSAQGDGGVWTVNSLSDPGDGTCNDSDCTLREAIAAADWNDQIVFASGLQGEIDVTAGEFVLARDVNIDGGGRISVDAQGDSRVLSIPEFAPRSSPSVTLSGLRLRQGYSPDGAGIRVGRNRIVTIRNSFIAENYADNQGGGIWIDSDASVFLGNSGVVDNHAIRTGATGGGIWSAGTLKLLNSTLARNSAPNQGAGGGIFVAAGGVEIRSSTVSGNTASYAGGIANGSTSGLSSPAGGVLTITSSTITANSLGIGHGGSGAKTYLTNTIVAGNTITGCSSISGGLFSLGHNLGSGCDLDFTLPGDVNVLAAQVFAQVLEQELKDNGGPTRTHALIARGLAVDRGYCPGETTDQRGFARPVDDPTLPNAKDGCDIGAYEAQGPQAAVADLMVSQAVDKSSVKQGELLTYTVRVQNLGPQAAPNVVLSNVLSSGVTFVEARQNKGSVTAPPRGETGTVTWNLGDMANQANEAAEIVVTVLVRGRATITNTATVSGNVADPNPANNSAAITVTVVAGKAGGKKG